jgi:hypothetical protein
MDPHLNQLLHNIKTKYNSAHTYDLKATYYPYRNINHTIRIRDGVIYVRLSDKIKQAPDEIISAAGRLLFDKLFRVQTDIHTRRSYRRYINQHLLHKIEPVKKHLSDAYTPKGQYYDLAEIFNKVNKNYFTPLLKMPMLGWSLNKSYRRLGFYDYERNLIVISQIFDSRKVPQIILEYLMYHEMLHIVFPARFVNGRRKIHTDDFNQREREFKDYESAQKWLARKLWRIRF